MKSLPFATSSRSGLCSCFDCTSNVSQGNADGNGSMVKLHTCCSKKTARVIEEKVFAIKLRGPVQFLDEVSIRPVWSWYTQCAVSFTECTILTGLNSKAVRNKNKCTSTIYFRTLAGHFTSKKPNFGRLNNSLRHHRNKFHWCNCKYTYFIIHPYHKCKLCNTQ